MNRTTLIIAFTLASAAGLARAQLTLSPANEPLESSTVFTAVGTKNQGNQKARLEASGFSHLQGGNPANGWWNNTVRSWEVSWDNTQQAITFDAFSSDDWSGTPVMSMTRAPQFAESNILVGLRIGARLTNDTHFLTLNDVQFDGGSGFVSIPSANTVYNGNVFEYNYFALNGPLADFSLRGTTLMTGPNVTSDGFRFFVSGVQAVPTPGSVAILGLAGLTAARRRRN